VLDCGDAGSADAGSSDGSGGRDAGLNQDSGLPNPTSTSCGRLSDSVCVIAADQTLKCSDGTNISGARCISTGENFLCFVTSAGTVECWGALYATYDGVYANTPIAIAGLESGAIDVAAGETHACALLDTGAVECWGGPRGEDNNAGRRWPAAPTRVPLGSAATVITSGDGFSCAIVAGGQIECWGSNVHQELGSRAASDGVTPVPVMGLPAPAVGVWADQATSPCALLTDGSVWCWGTVSTIDTYANFPTVAGSPPAPQTGFAAPVRALTTGGEEGMSCALLTTGAVQCWGQGISCLGDANGAAGSGGAGCCTDTCPAPQRWEFSVQPVDILPAGSGAIELRSDDQGACALLANGSVTCWGGVHSPLPTPVPGF
jgi:hypothetical protein